MGPRTSRTSTPPRHGLEYFAEVCVDRLAIRNHVVAAIPGDVGMLVMELSGETGVTPEWPLILLSAGVGPVGLAALPKHLSCRLRGLARSSPRWWRASGSRRGASGADASTSRVGAFSPCRCEPPA